MNNLEYNYKLDLVSNLVILSKVLEDEYSIHLQDFDSKSENLSFSQVEKFEDHYFERFFGVTSSKSHKPWVYTKH